MKRQQQATWFLLGINQREFNSLLPQNFERVTKASVQTLSEPEPELSGEEWLLKNQFGLSWPLPYAAWAGPNDSDNNEQQVIGQWVYLQADQRQVFMMGSDDLAVSDDESQALLDDINDLLAQDPFELYVDDEGVIYASNTQAVSVPERSPASLMNHSVYDELRPLSHNAWAKAFAEIQMLLSEHTVNQQRRSRGQLPVNALWLWGDSNSDSSSIQKPDFQTICSDDVFWRRLAEWAGLNYQPFSMTRAQKAQSSTLFVLSPSELIDQLMRPRSFWHNIFVKRRQPIYFLLQDGQRYIAQRLPWWRRWLTIGGS